MWEYINVDIYHIEVRESRSVPSTYLNEEVPRSIRFLVEVSIIKTNFMCAYGFTAHFRMPVSRHYSE
jgi:hypothetical protein